VLLEARHEDNPRLWNGREWTVEGVRYLERLAGLSGARLQRLGYGRWVQAEGIVYEEWDGAVHLVDGGAIRAEWPRLWSIDFGFTNPNVWQEWALDPDRRLYLAREHVRTGELPGELAALLRRAGTRPLEAVCDHDAAGRAELEKLLQIRTRPAFKEVLAGIQAVKARLRPAADGRPRLFVARGCLLGRDPRMDERREPIGLAEEIDVYRWREDGGRDEPVPEHDHSMDAMRYAVAWTDNLGRREMRVY
jgi:phage terminase large subunit